MIGGSTWDEQAAIGADWRFVGVTNGGPSEFSPTTTVASDLLEAVELAMGL